MKNLFFLLKRILHLGSTISRALLFLLLMCDIYFLSAAQPQHADNTQIAQKNKVQRIRSLSTEACRRIAYDFLKSGSEQTKAIPYLEYLLEKETNSNPADIHALAKAYYYNNQFDLAIDLIQEYTDKVKGRKLKFEAKKELDLYQNAKRIALDSRNVQLINLGSNINTKNPEVNPYVSENENLLVYSTRKSRDYNIYVSKKQKNKTIWSKAKNAGNLVNTINDELVAGLSHDGKHLFVHYTQESGFEDINTSVRIKGLFRELDNIGKKVNSTYREEGACYSKTGDTLFFASNREGGFGGLDLYYSLKLPDGTWGKPLNMGETINTPEDENYPYIDPNGSNLYFASKGHEGMGGYDLFYTYWDHMNNDWAKPKNLGFPINNPYDNKTISFTRSPRYAYISTIMREGMGSYDIYKVVFLDKDADYLVVSGNIFVKDSTGLKEFKEYNSHVSITLEKDNELYGIYAYNRKYNHFILALEPGTYFLNVKADDFLPVKKKFTIPENHYRNKKRKINIYLQKNTLKNTQK